MGITLEFLSLIRILKKNIPLLEKGRGDLIGNKKGLGNVVIKYWYIFFKINEILKKMLARIK